MVKETNEDILEEYPLILEEDRYMIMTCDINDDLQNLV